jgi:hypothetical protein
VLATKASAERPAKQLVRRQSKNTTSERPNRSDPPKGRRLSVGASRQDQRRVRHTSCAPTLRRPQLAPAAISPSRQTFPRRGAGRTHALHRECAVLRPDKASVGPPRRAQRPLGPRARRLVGPWRAQTAGRARKAAPRRQAEGHPDRVTPHVAALHVARFTSHASRQSRNYDVACGSSLAATTRFRPACLAA